MGKAKFAIIGRPNVGKSTLFNVLTGKRKAVVKDRPGVTRDLQRGQVEWLGQYYEVIDSGGIADQDFVFCKSVEEQVKGLLNTVDGVIVILDVRSGLCPGDEDVLVLARKSDKPVLILANKADTQELRDQSYVEFAHFGFSMIPTSLEKREGIDQVLEWMSEGFESGEDEHVEGSIKISIVGKPNAGKSLLCNKILGKNRMLVSDIAGTTVDAIDSNVEIENQVYTFIDTAGLRKKAKIKDDIEVLASFKTREAIRRSDIIWLLVDVLLGPSDQDSKIMQYAFENHKAVILVCNKSDLAKENKVPEYRKTLRSKIKDEFHFVNDLPVLFVSAKTGQGIDKLLNKTKDIYSKLKFRISTSELNKFFFETIRKAPAPVSGSKDVKFYYLTQTQQQPPSFIAYANDPRGVTSAYRRFLVKNMKAHWGLEGVPIRLFAMKSRGRGEADNRGVY